MELADKYSKSAPGFSEYSYTNPDEFMERRAQLILDWGTPLQPGNSVLELCCGDGSLGRALGRLGLRYTGSDLAPGMVEAARARLAAARMEERCFIMDVNSPNLGETFDAVVGFRTFFTYAKRPLPVLEVLRPHVRKKVVVDWNHYSPMGLWNAVGMMRQAGFTQISYRPFLVPMKRQLPRSLQKLLYAFEEVPHLGLLPTRWKFSVLIKGEVE